MTADRSTGWLAAVTAALATAEAQSFSSRKTIVPAMKNRPVDANASGLELGGMIGEGGMGVVHGAVQRSLGREVAVKMLHPENERPDYARQLLQEAWTTGALEHPNIIPVHDIKLSPTGAPQVILKRIRGRAWSELMMEEGRVLDRDLRILMDVARAVDFAHEIGFIHRDVKPENVLVGSHQDVYLADWGISVALHDDGTGRFPLAEDIDAFAGTPAYVAPEMVDPTLAGVGPWTDIYLLGAVLFELVEGEPPHVVDSTSELLTSVFSPPRLASADRELAAIGERALAVEPKDRFERAGAFRQAIAEYLAHEGARAIAARADASAARWKAFVDKAASEADTALAEARFGYAAAIEAWPESTHAASHQRALELDVVHAEIDAGHLDVARRALARVDDPPADLVLRLNAAQTARRQSERRARLRDAMTDLTTGSRMRNGVVGSLCTIWVLSPLLRDPLSRATPLGILAPYVLSVFLVGALVFIGRRSLFDSYVNRAVTMVIGGVMVADLLLAVMASRYELGFLWLFQTLPIVWACAGAIGVGLI
ncbi:MAG: serine/threonine-protein kinase, partial [Myxococcota bacterium]